MKQKKSGFGAAIRRGLDAILAPAEDPRKKFSYTQQSELLESVQRALAVVDDARQQLLSNAVELQAGMPLIERETIEAAEKGQDDLVSLVKPRADMAAQLITDLETRIAELDRDRERLSTLQKQLQSEIASGLSRQEIASTQVYASNVQSRVKDVLAEVTRVLDDLD